MTFVIVGWTAKIREGFIQGASSLNSLPLGAAKAGSQTIYINYMTSSALAPKSTPKRNAERTQSALYVNHYSAAPSNSAAFNSVDGRLVLKEVVWKWYHSIGLHLSYSRWDFQTHRCRPHPARGLKCSTTLFLLFANNNCIPISAAIATHFSHHTLIWNNGIEHPPPCLRWR